MYDVYWLEDADVVINFGVQNTLNTFPGSEHNNENNQKIINQTEYSIIKQT
jgi:hypothetical protein